MTVIKDGIKASAGQAERPQNLIGSGCECKAAQV